MRTEKIQFMMDLRAGRNTTEDQEQRKATIDLLEKITLRAKHHIHQNVLVGIVPVFGVAVISLFLSWNAIRVKFDAMSCREYEFMNKTLAFVTIIFQSMFAIVVFCLWSMDSFFFFLDVLVLITSIILDVFRYSGNWTTLDSLYYTSYLASVSYMTFRSWARVVHSQNDSWRRLAMRDGLKTFSLVWVTRSASLAASVLPDIDDIMQELTKVWGTEDLHKVCRISIYVTDKDKAACDMLRDETKESKVSIAFKRPDFEAILEDHIVEMIANEKQSQTVIPFCGSPKLASTINKIKLATDAIVVTAGYKHHKMEFVGESYGGVKSPNKSIENSELQTSPMHDTVQKRKTISTVRMTGDVEARRASNVRFL